MRKPNNWVSFWADICTISYFSAIFGDIYVVLIKQKNVCVCDQAVDFSSTVDNPAQEKDLLLSNTPCEIVSLLRQWVIYVGYLSDSENKQCSVLSILYFIYESGVVAKTVPINILRN